jgi:hypothetical protein
VERDIIGVHEALHPPAPPKEPEYQKSWLDSPWAPSVIMLGMFLIMAAPEILPELLTVGGEAALVGGEAAVVGGEAAFVGSETAAVAAGTELATETSLATSLTNPALATTTATVAAATQTPAGQNFIEGVEENLPVLENEAQVLSEETITLHHGSVSNYSNIMTSGLDPNRTPTWVTTQLQAAQNAIGSGRVLSPGEGVDMGIITSNVSRSAFEALQPNGVSLLREWPGFGDVGETFSEFVLRSPEAIELFNSGICRKP